MGTREEQPLPVRSYVRMEREAGAAERDFWEVVVRDRTLWTRAGPIGHDGAAAAPRVYLTADEALDAAEDLAASQRALGFEEVVHVRGEHARDRQLEAAILAHPDDASGYLVYADWLQENGDPRGELVMIDYRLEKKSRDARLLRARRRFERKHRALLLPERVHAMRRTARPRWQLDRKYGFLYEARIGRADAHLPYTLRELLLALLFHPSAALLNTLRIGPVVPEIAAPDTALDQAQPSERPRGPFLDYRPVVAALTKAAPPSLRQLRLVELDEEPRDGAIVHLGPIDELFTALPWLTDIRVCADELRADEIAAPALRRFALDTPNASSELLDALDRAHWPALEALHLSGRDRPIDIGALTRLLAGRHVPALHTLAITHTRDTGEILHALMRAPLLRGIRVLDLSYGDLSDNDVAAMSEQANAFRSLEGLVLDGNYISRAARADVRQVCPDASLADQRGAAAERPRYRHADVVEFACDYASLIAARGVAKNRAGWSTIATWGRILWGRYRGTADYELFVEVRAGEDMESGCTCPSTKYPCKHALGLLILVAEMRGSLVEEPPEGFIENCRASNQ